MVEEKFPRTCERFIAYFDIMGFRDFIYRNSHEQVEKTMDVVSDIVNEIKETEEVFLSKTDKAEREIEKAIIMPVIFSDTVIMITGSNTIHDMRKAIYASSFLLSAMLGENVPVKGALSHGVITADFKKSIYFGKPLIDAYLLSEETFFYGATLHHSFEKFIAENKAKIPKTVINHGKVPMKSGNVTHCYMDFKNFIDEPEDRKKIMEKFYLSVSGTTRKYVDNTLDVYLK